MTCNKLIADDLIVKQRTILEDILPSRNNLGENVVIQQTPIVQSYIPYGIIHSQLYSQFTGGSGAISATESQLAQLATSTTQYSYAVLRSKRALKYRPGSSIITKFTFKFDSDDTSSLQFIGAGNAQSDLYFCQLLGGINIRRSTGGLLHIVKLTVAVAENTTATATVTLNSVAYNVSLTNAGGTIAFTAHQIEIGDFNSLWNTEHVGSVIFFIGSDVGARSGTYSYSSTGASTGTFTTVATGSALTTTYVPRSKWNGSNTSFINSLDFSKRQMGAILYTLYGSGNINFQLYNSAKDKYETVHTMTFSNQSADLSLSDFNLFIQSGIYNLIGGVDTDSSMTVSGVYGAVQGVVFRNEPQQSVSNTTSIVGNTEKVVLSILNRAQINGYSNQSEIFLSSISVAVDGTKPVLIRLVKNCILSADTTSDFTNYSFTNETESILLTDINAISRTNGFVLYQFYLAKADSITLDLTSRNFKIGRTETISVVALSTSNSDISASLSVVIDL